MRSPAYEITDFGVFDSEISFPRIKRTNMRQVTGFEIELCTTDQAGVISVSGKDYPVACGTLVCAKPGTTRRMVSPPFKCLYFHISTQDEGLRALLFSLPDVAVLNDISEPTRIFHEMLGIQSLSTPESTFLLQSLVARFFAFLAPLGRTWSDKGASSAYLHQRALLSVEQMIRNDPAGKLDLKTLAAKANLSPVYFHRIFTEYFGKTPSRYVLDCRIAAAKFRLVTEDGSMAEIAASCGFSSQAYFNCRFKEIVGQTPLQYRKSMLSRVWS